MFLLMERSSTSRLCSTGSNWPGRKEIWTKEQLSKNAGVGGWASRRGLKSRGPQGWSEPLSIQGEGKHSQLWLSSYPILGIFTFFFFFGIDFSKFHLPTNVPSSKVSMQSTSSSVRILHPAWNSWGIRGTFPPTLLFQDKFSSSRSGINLSASSVTKWPEDWSLVHKADNAFQSQPNRYLWSIEAGQVLVRCQGTKKRKGPSPYPLPARGASAFTDRVHYSSQSSEAMLTSKIIF